MVSSRMRRLSVLCMKPFLRSRQVFCKVGLAVEICAPIPSRWKAIRFLCSIKPTRREKKMEYNEKLKSWVNNVPSTDAGINSIQKPGVVEHIVWQNRSHEPTRYELQLVQSLITAFKQGAKELDAIVNSLNEQGVLLE